MKINGKRYNIKIDFAVFLDTIEELGGKSLQDATNVFINEKEIAKGIQPIAKLKNQATLLFNALKEDHPNLKFKDVLNATFISGNQKSIEKAMLALSSPLGNDDGVDEKK